MLSKKLFQKFCKKIINKNILEKTENAHLNQTKQAINQFFGHQENNPNKIKKMENNQKSYVEEKLKMIDSLKGLKTKSNTLKFFMEQNIKSQKDIIKIIKKIQKSAHLLSFYQKEKFYLVESNLMSILKKLSILIQREDKIHLKNKILAKKNKEIIHSNKLNLSKNYQDLIFYLNKNFDDFLVENRISILVYLNIISKYENKELIKEKIWKLIETKDFEKLSFQNLCMLMWLMSSVSFKNKVFLKNFDNVIFDKFEKEMDNLYIFNDYKELFKEKEKEKKKKNGKEENSQKEENLKSEENLGKEKKLFNEKNLEKEENLENKDLKKDLSENELNSEKMKYDENEEKKVIKISLKKLSSLLLSYTNVPITSSVPKLLIKKILAEKLIKNADPLVCLNLLTTYNILQPRLGYKILYQLSEKFLKEKKNILELSNLTHINFISVFSKIRPNKNKKDFNFFLEKNNNPEIEERIILEENNIKKMINLFFSTFLEKQKKFSNNKNFSLVFWNLALYNFNLEKKQKMILENFLFEKINTLNNYDTVLIIYSLSKLISNFSLNPSLNFQYEKIVNLLITRCIILKNQLDRRQMHMIDEVVQKNIKEFKNLKRLFKDNN